jgi:hypothetical protein
LKFCNGACLFKFQIELYGWYLDNKFEVALMKLRLRLKSFEIAGKGYCRQAKTTNKSK